jgi:hypothetical protein
VDEAITPKTQFDLERHGGRTIAGVASRVLQRILALTAAICTTTNSADPRYVRSPPTITEPLELLI